MTPALYAVQKGSALFPNIILLAIDQTTSMITSLFSPITAITKLQIIKAYLKKKLKNRKRHLINKTITTYGLNAMKIAKRNNFGVIALPFLLYHLVDLGYMSKEQDQMGYGEIDYATSRPAITGKGKSILDKWFASQSLTFYSSPAKACPNLPAGCKKLHYS